MLHEYPERGLALARETEVARNTEQTPNHCQMRPAAKAFPKHFELGGGRKGLVVTVLQCHCMEEIASTKLRSLDVPLEPSRMSTVQPIDLSRTSFRVELREAEEMEYDQDHEKSQPESIIDAEDLVECDLARGRGEKEVDDEDSIDYEMERYESIEDSSSSSSLSTLLSFSFSESNDHDVDVEDLEAPPLSKKARKHFHSSIARCPHAACKLPNGERVAASFASMNVERRTSFLRSAILTTCALPVTINTFNKDPGASERQRNTSKRASEGEPRPERSRMIYGLRGVRMCRPAFAAVVQLSKSTTAKYVAKVTSQ